jgi:hypothetical protein
VSEEIPAAAVVLTKVAIPEALAAACALQKVAIDAVPTAIGCVAVCRSAALGDPETAAQIISSALAKSPTPVILLVQREGQMSASRWAGGTEQEELSAALMLDGAPPEVEDLLLGQVVAADLPGVVSSVGVSRWRAMRMLGGVAAANRRAARAAGTAADTDEPTAG